MLADRRKAVIVAIGSAVVPALLLAVVLNLGSWAYHTRRFLSHERRLARLLTEHPTAGDVYAALRSDRTARFDSIPLSEENLSELARRASREQIIDIQTKRRTWPDTRLYRVDDMVYVLFFDRDRRLQAYTLLNR